MRRQKTRVTETVQGPPSARSELLVGAQNLLEATAARIRNEVTNFEDSMLDEKLLLLQQLDHLHAALALLEKFLPAGRKNNIPSLTPEELCDACKHLNMAVHTMLALAPKFREGICHRLERQLGVGFGKRFDCCSRGRPAVELSSEKRKSRLRTQLQKLEKQHERCLLELLLSFEFLSTAEVLPPPDAPSRCLEGSKYVLAGQMKLYQSHAMLCQFLVEEDDLLLPLLEWQLDAATSDFAIARAVVERLPRASRRRSCTNPENHFPPLATVGVRCESKAQISQCHFLRDPSVRFADSTPYVSPRQADAGLLQTPVLATQDCIPPEVQDKCRGCVSKGPYCSTASAIKPQEVGARETDDCHVSNNKLPNQRCSSSLPDLEALGPCNFCNLATHIKNPCELASRRHDCTPLNASSCSDDEPSSLDFKVAEHASLALTPGCDYRRH